MRLLEAREGRDAVNGSVTVWRPWQIKQLELLRAVAVSIPSRQRLIQEYLLISAQSGAAYHQYRNTRINDQDVDGALLVIEPGETWTCHSRDCTFHHPFIDPAWLQQFATEMLHREKCLPHFPSHPLFDPSLSRAVCDLAGGSLASVSRLQQEEMLLRLFAPLLRPVDSSGAAWLNLIEG